MAVTRFLIFLVITFIQEESLCTPIKIFNDGGDDFFDNVFRGLRSMLEDSSIEDNNFHNETSQTNTVETNRVVELPNGIEKIEKLVQKESPNDTNNNAEKKLTEFFKFPNHTIQKVEREGENLVKRDESQVECVDSIDCNSTAFCDRFSYTCKSCHTESESCGNGESCCPGHTCDDVSKTCKKTKGGEGQLCSSVSDCTNHHCCALNNNGDGVCQPYLKEGNDCGSDPFASLFSPQKSYYQEALSGLPNRCPCASGLSCQKQQTFFFLESEVCTKKEENKRNPKIVKISIRKLSPAFSFHSDDDLDDLPLPGLLSNEKSAKKQRKTKNRRRRRRKMKTRNHYFSKPQLSRKRKNRKRKMAKHHLLSSRRHIPFPFADIMPSLRDDDFNDDDMDDDFDDDEDDDIFSHLPIRRKIGFVDEMDNETPIRQKREDLEDIHEEARDLVHEAVDGVFDSVMKGIIEALKYGM